MAEPSTGAVGTLSEKDVRGARKAAAIVVDIHRRLVDFLRPGLTLAQIDAFVAQSLEANNARSCFRGYKPGREPAFPSHACLSVNDCVVHGTAGYLARPLAPGDCLKVDIGVLHEGWIGDAGWTYLFTPVAPEVRRLTNASKEGLRRSVAMLAPGRPLIDWARSLQTYVEKEQGFHLVRGLGGHGYFRGSLHHAPFVSNVMPAAPGEWPDAHKLCTPGMILAVEPMVAIGTGATRQKRGEWPIYIADGSCSVHHEHDVLVTESGPEVLTAGLDELPDEIG